MPDPILMAKKILLTKNIGDIPALSLKQIAYSEHIKYIFKPYMGDWDGALFFHGNQRAILVNTAINNAGRHNFTFAHELGHYFLMHQPSYEKDGQGSIRCKLSEIDTEKKSREADANRFAVELLMPQEQFSFDMLGADIDFALITGLANRYMVSKQACSNRILSLTKSPCIIIRSNGTINIGYCESKAAKGFLKNVNTMPKDTAAYKAALSKSSPYEFSNCSADLWLNRSVPSNTIQECTHVHADSGLSMTILRW